MPCDFDVSRPRLIRDGSFLERDWHEIARRRRVPNRLGFAYQAAFVRVLGRSPHLEPEVLGVHFNRDLARTLKRAQGQRSARLKVIASKGRMLTGSSSFALAMSTHWPSRNSNASSVRSAGSTSHRCPTPSRA